jgi:hypothetical protein
MALATHTAILKARKGELQALATLDGRTLDRVQPIFEIGRLTDQIRERKYMRESRTPTISYLDRALAGVSEVWGDRVAVIDGFEWAPQARTESGDSVIPYMVDRLRRYGTPVVPVVGYDRWSNSDYRAGLVSVEAHRGRDWYFRFDKTAVEDASEPDYFGENVLDMLDTLDAHPNNCAAIVDFGDISMSTASIEYITNNAIKVLNSLQSLGFERFVFAGCSMPRTINLAVDSADTDGFLIRKEMLVWQALRAELQSVTIGFGDYALRGPTTSEFPSKYTNGKIRHTVTSRLFIVRGHPFRNDGCHVQMEDLARRLIASGNYLGPDFSWGDDQIELASRGLARRDLGHWIAVDTNHHLTFVVQEIEEFERAIARSARRETASDRG